MRGRATDASTTQIANLRTKRRTKPIGPSSASTVASAPKTSFHSHLPSKPNTRSESAAAAVAITISSKIAQPRHWARSAPSRDTSRAGRAAPQEHHRRHPASAPIIAGDPSIALPIRPPTSDRDQRLSARARSSAATSTSSEMPRFPQSGAVSKPPSTRSRSGTGSMPQAVRPSAHALPSPALPGSGSRV